MSLISQAQSLSVKNGELEQELEVFYVKQWANVQ